MSLPRHPFLGRTVLLRRIRSQIILVMSRHRAKIRPTHGEIEILSADPLTAMRSRDVQDYAADDTSTGHGGGVDLKVGPQGVHEWVTLSENKIGDLTQRSNIALRGADQRSISI